MAPLPDARLGNEIRRTDQCGAGDGANALVERHVHAVEEPGNLGICTPIERSRFPEARTVHVYGDAAFTCPGCLRLELRPRRKLAADLALRQLEQQRAQRA